MDKVINEKLLPTISVSIGSNKKRYNTVTDWDSMGRAMSFLNTRLSFSNTRVFQTLGQAFDFFLRLQKLGRVFEKLGRAFKGSAVCFKTSTRPSVSLKRVYENLVCKKHHIFIGV